MKKSLLYLSLVSLLTAMAPVVTADEVPLIPMRDFFRNAERTAFTLSPDGKHLAFLAPWESRLNIHVQELGSDEVRRITGSTERDIWSYFWANENQLVYLQDQGGDENYNLYIVGLDGKDVRNLTPFPEATVSVIDSLKDIPEEMIISMNRRDQRVFDAYRLNLDSGELKLIAENPGNITGWMTDHAGRLRVALVTDGISSSFLYRSTEEEEFQVVFTTDFRTTVSPLFFTFDNQHVYASSDRDRERQAIVRMDPATGNELEVIFSHPEVDVSSLLKSDHRKVITGVSYNVDSKFG
jgi:hypothetical protein